MNEPDFCLNDCFAIGFFEGAEECRMSLKKADAIMDAILPDGQPSAWADLIVMLDKDSAGYCGYQLAYLVKTMKPRYLGEALVIAFSMAGAVAGGVLNERWKHN